MNFDRLCANVRYIATPRDCRKRKRRLLTTSRKFAKEIQTRKRPRLSVCRQPICDFWRLFRGASQTWPFPADFALWLLTD